MFVAAQKVVTVVLAAACAGIGFGLAGRVGTWVAGRKVAPSLSFASPPSVNFGLVTEGSVVERTVRVRNVSDKSLVVERVSTSCGCTTTTAPAHILPHRDAPLTIRFDSRSRRGAFRETARLTFRDAASPPLVVLRAA